MKVSQMLGIIALVIYVLGFYTLMVAAFSMTTPNATETEQTILWPIVCFALIEWGVAGAITLVFIGAKLAEH